MWMQAFLTFDRKLFDVTVVTDKHHLLFEELGWCGTKCNLKTTTTTTQIYHYEMFDIQFDNSMKRNKFLFDALKGFNQVLLSLLQWATPRKCNSAMHQPKQNLKGAMSVQILRLIDIKFSSYHWRIISRPSNQRTIWFNLFFKGSNKLLKTAFNDCTSKRHKERTSKSHNTLSSN